MTIKSLESIPFDTILDCFLEAFENYYVKMPTDRNYYKNRWNEAKVNFKLSYGMFENNKLIGFIIHAIDNREGVLTAFNTGTGVLPEFRGKRIVKEIYKYALKDLKRNGIIRSTLEVITKNSKAIRSYESVGFKIVKNYSCFSGEIKESKYDPITVIKSNMEQFDWGSLPNQSYYSWDFQKETIVEGDSDVYQISINDVVESYFIINLKKQMLLQFDVLCDSNKNWENLFQGIRKISSSIRVINVDSRLKDKLRHIKKAGLKNTVNQYEMKLELE